MNRERAARAYNLISEGFAELSLAVSEGIDQPAAGGAKAPHLSPAPAADSMPEFPPLEGFEEAPQAAEKPHNTALGMCPSHRTAWTVKAGGISKNGKPYKAFWKCSGKTDDGYCNEKPTKAWADSHPIPLEVVA